MTKYDPRWYKRWARIYVNYMDNFGKEVAHEWAERFLEDSSIPRVQREIKKLRQGEKPKPPPRAS